MKKYFTLSVFCFCSVLYGQTNKTIMLTGAVTSNRSKKPVFDAVFVVLKINDSILIKTPSDSSGQYVIYSDTKTLTNNNCVIFAYQDQSILVKQKGRCGIILGESYLNSSLNKIKLSRPLKDTVITNFSLTYTYIDGTFPEFFFQENSAKYLQDSLKYFNDNLDYLKCVITENSFLTEISAHADPQEKEPLTLSQARGEFIKQELIKRGVPPDLLVVKGYGAERPIVTNYELKKVKSKEEKFAGRQKNMRTVFSILKKVNK